MTSHMFRIYQEARRMRDTLHWHYTWMIFAFILWPPILEWIANLMPDPSWIWEIIITIPVAILLFYVMRKQYRTHNQHLQKIYDEITVWYGEEE